MPRMISVYTPQEHHEWIKQALEMLADDVITDEEAGQRGTKLSKLILMLATAYIGNVTETARLMREIKALTGFESRQK